MQSDDLARAASPARAAEQHSVLVVNDSPEQLTFTVELLRDAGYRVLSAYDGLAGMEAVRREHPDLIISDVVMPRADGFELCRQVRAAPELHSTPVLLMSGLATDSESAVAGMNAGADDYLEIPFDPMRLVSKVARLIERRDAEDRLRRQLDFTEAITNSLGEGVLAFDADARLTFINPAAEAALGWRSAEATGAPTGDLLAIRAADGSLLAGAESPLETSLQSGRTIRRETDSFARRDGSAFPVSYVTAPIHSGGRTVGVVLTFHDITERAEADARLRREREALREAQRLAQVGSWSWSLDDGRVVWSEELYRIAGRDPSRGAPSWSDQRTMYGANGDQLYAAVERVLATGEPYEVEVEVIRPDGDRRWAVARGEVLRDAAGDTVALRGTFQDTTERHEQRQMLQRANESLERSERRYRYLIENLNDVVFSFDAEDRFVYVSPSVQKYGYAPDELIGRHHSVTTHPDDVAECDAELQRARGGVVRPHEFRLVDKAGGTHYVRSSARAIVENGRYAGLTGVLIDVTAQRHAEDQLRAAQRLEAVGRLAGGVAHDFNNLLVAIIGYAEFAIEGVPEGDQMRHDLEEILKAGHRAAALTRQLLAFSRKQVLSPEVIGLNEVITGMAGMLRRLIGEDIDFRIVLQPGLGPVLADPGQMEQVIMNLVVNARDAMPTGGTMTVGTASESGGDEQGQADRIVLLVSDTGTGMDEQTKEQIFEPFFTTKGPGEGTGLGLSTVHGIVSQSGGTIDVDTAPGKGTTFRLSFPRARAAASAEHTAVPVRSSSGRETILIVEDEPAVRALARRFLDAAGYRVLTAENGGEALTICETHGGPIDLLLTDVVMPQMSGRALWDRLSGLRPDLRVLYMSGYSGTAIAHHGVLDEGLYLIQKPFNAAELTRRVREVLEKED